MLISHDICIGFIEIIVIATSIIIIIITIIIGTISLWRDLRRWLGYGRSQGSWRISWGSGSYMYIYIYIYIYIHICICTYIYIYIYIYIYTYIHTYYVIYTRFNIHVQSLASRCRTLCVTAPKSVQMTIIIIMTTICYIVTITNTITIITII